MKPEATTQFRERCGHIVEWGARIPVYVQGMTYDDFFRNDVAHLAVWKCVEVLGEASAQILKLNAGLETRFPRLQLKEAYAMRNRLTHGYSYVDLMVLWTTIHNFVPPMVEEARRILSLDEFSN